MKRKALLIGSPGYGDSYLKGVSLDMQNIKHFLKSSNGGSWKDSEIFISNTNPSYAEIEKHLVTLESVDFSFVYFSGHGFTDQNGVGRINLNELEKLPISKFENRTLRQITIIDACRGYSEYIGFDGLGAPAVEIQFDYENSAVSRVAFDNYLKSCTKGSVLIHAAQKGQNAQDTEKGGYFSHNLLMATLKIVKQTSKPIVDVGEIFSQTFISTQDKHQPALIPSNSFAVKLPFAVKSYSTYNNKYALEQPTSTMISKTNPWATPLKIGAFVGVVLLVKQIFFSKKK